MTPQQYAPLIVLLVLLPIILLRNRAPRTLRPQWMWVTPAIVVPLIGLGLWGSSQAQGADHTPFDTVSWLILAVGLGLGCVAGWWRGKMTTIQKHADGTLKAQASPLGIILIVGLFLGRSALRSVLEPHAAAWHLNALAVADAFLLFAVGMIVVQRIEMFIRARRVLAGRPDSHVEAAV
ncbi:CcdC protein domain-containing protein [Brevundimonas staleyi]|uniref:CcdC protein domain-containing protein n=1 Tax=Brevundimonas staleyi TaxID=74326 RepID=A0ABW0FVS1_9CAUL